MTSAAERRPNAPRPNVPRPNAPAPNTPAPNTLRPSLHGLTEPGPTEPGAVAPGAIATRAIAQADLSDLSALNEAAVPAVNSLSLARFAAHVPRCEVAVVIDDDAGLPVAFLLALAPGADYDSENYRWFEANRPGSLYVDRIVVDPAAHGRGLGRLLYAAVHARAGALGLAQITCEVNLEPPNPGSLAFHARLGFDQIGEQITKGGSVRVALLALAISQRDGTVDRQL